MINVQKSRERFKAATQNMDYERAVVLGGIFGELMHEVERLQEKERIYELSDELYKKQVKNVKHLFPHERVPGIGQVIDALLSFETENKQLTKKVISLEDAVNKWRDMYVKYYTENIIAQQENERLRSALEKVLNLTVCEAIEAVVKDALKK